MGYVSSQEGMILNTAMIEKKTAGYFNKRWLDGVFWVGILFL